MIDNFAFLNGQQPLDSLGKGGVNAAQSVSKLDATSIAQLGEFQSNLAQILNLDGADLQTALQTVSGAALGDKTLSANPDSVAFDLDLTGSDLTQPLDQDAFKAAHEQLLALHAQYKSEGKDLLAVSPQAQPFQSLEQLVQLQNGSDAVAATELAAALNVPAAVTQSTPLPGLDQPQLNAALMQQQMGTSSQSNDLVKQWGGLTGHGASSLNMPTTPELAQSLTGMGLDSHQAQNFAEQIAASPNGLNGALGQEIVAAIRAANPAMVQAVEATMTGAGEQPQASLTGAMKSPLETSATTPAATPTTQAADTATLANNQAQASTTAQTGAANSETILDDLAAQQRAEGQALMTEAAQRRAAQRSAATPAPQAEQHAATQASFKQSLQANGPQNGPQIGQAGQSTGDAAQSLTGGQSASNADTGGQSFGQSGSDQQNAQQQAAAWKAAKVPSVTLTIPTTIQNDPMLAPLEMGALSSLAGGLTAGTSGAQPSLFSGTLAQHNSAAQMADARDMAKQVGLQVGKQMHNGVNEFTIKLNPRDLGTVTVKLAFDSAGKVSAAVSADSAQTLDMLKAETKGIERAIESSGHKIEGHQIDFNLDQHNERSAGHSLADEILKDNQREMAERDRRLMDNDDLAVTAREEEVNLDDILPYVTPETGLDIRV